MHPRGLSIKIFSANLGPPNDKKRFFNVSVLQVSSIRIPTVVLNVNFNRIIFFNLFYILLIDNSLFLQYDYNPDEDSARDSSDLGTNPSSQDELSSDETVLRAQKSRLNSSKKSSSPFSRSSYVRRRAPKRPLPMSSLAKTPVATVISQATATSDACSSPSNTESGKENDVNFSTSTSKISPKKESSLLPEVSSAIFVRDEFDSTGEDVLNLGKGKRKRFLNVRMFPIGETISQKILEVSSKMEETDGGMSPVPTPSKKSKIVETTAETPTRRSSVDSTTSVDKKQKESKVKNDDKRRASVENISSKKVRQEKRRNSAEEVPKGECSSTGKEKLKSSNNNSKKVKESAVSSSTTKTKKKISKESKAKDELIQVDDEISFKVSVAAHKKLKNNL